MANVRLSWIRRDGTATEVPSLDSSLEELTARWPYRYLVTTTKNMEVFVSQSKLTIEDARRLLRCEVDTFEEC